MTIDDPDTLAELQDLANRYETALAANDLATLDAMFWQSPAVVRFGVGECLYGIAAIAAFRAARPGGSPPRTVVRMVVTAFGQDAGVANVEFRRDRDGTTGRQSQTWMRLPEGWRIVAAHVSLIGTSH